MSNLENLTQKILDDGKIEVARIEQESKKNNEEIINSRTKEANQEKDKILEKANREATMLKERIISETELKVRDENLKTRREVLDRVFNLAKENLKKIEEMDYLKFLKNCLEEININGSEVLIIPEKFKQAVKKSELHSNISEDESIESGFLLRDSNIMINYSFESLVDFIRDDIEGDIAKELFQE